MRQFPDTSEKECKMKANIVAYCRTHAVKASDDSRHVDAEVFSIAADVIEHQVSVLKKVLGSNWQRKWFKLDFDSCRD